MAFALTVSPQTTINGGVNASSFNLSLASCSAGNAVIFGCYWGDTGSTITSAALTSESNGTLVGSPAENSGANGDARVQIGYFQNLSASGTKTLTITLSKVTVFGLGLFAFEVSGGSTTSLLDAHNEGIGTSASPSLSLTTTQANDLIVAIVAGGTGSDPTQGAGFTLIPVTQFGARNAGQYQLDAGASGSPSVGFTLGASDNYAMAVAAFKLAGGGAITPSPGQNHRSQTFLAMGRR